MIKHPHYLTGFGSYFESEAIVGALPKGQNSPQKVPLDLYAEQLSGSAFTAPRHSNLRSWLYRILPSVKHGAFSHYRQAHFPLTKQLPLSPPTQMRWSPPPYPKEKTDFIQGLIPFAQNGDSAQHSGATIYLYAINASMQDNYFYDADGDLLIVLQEGGLLLHTEFGLISAEPAEIVVIPRGIKFQVELSGTKARGYICENYGSHFILPERGVIGSNSLANNRDFLIPTAAFEKKVGDFQLIAKFQQALWVADIGHSPLDVVAWHGNYTPYKYDLRLFNTINTVSFDHPDPSIFTVLTSPSNIAGVANVDFVIFPERWMVAEHTFRPPYFHRNLMSEFMGLVYGSYDAKAEGFMPGGSSLHNCMSAHGPDANAFAKATQVELKPEYYQGTLAFMFESCYVWQPTELALKVPFRQEDYLACWQGLEAKFK
jgi:homogentisate 1,2-dioxygenase